MVEECFLCVGCLLENSRRERERENCGGGNGEKGNEGMKE